MFRVCLYTSHVPTDGLIAYNFHGCYFLIVIYCAEPNVLRAVRQQSTAVESDTGLGQRVHAIR